MKSQWIIAAAIAALFAASTGGPTSAHGPDAASAPAGTAGAATKTNSLQLDADFQGASRQRANPTRPLQGIGEVDAQMPADLEEEFECLDEQAAKAASELRRLQTELGPRHPRIVELRTSLRSTVARSFEIRQQLQRHELAEYQRRLARVEQQIEEREPLKAAIIDRRVEELISPALTWNAEESSGAEAKEVGGGITLPAEPALPKSEGFAAASGKKSDSKSALREQFVSRFPETAAPEISGPHRDTFLAEFVDISPDRELVATVRRIKEKDSFACALWDRETGRRLAETLRPGNPVVVRFSANGAYVGVSTFWTNQFEVFQVPTGEFIQTVEHEPYTSWEAAFNRFAEDKPRNTRVPEGRATTPGAGATSRSLEVLKMEGFDDLTVRFDDGKVQQAFLVGLQPIPPELGPLPRGSEQFQDRRTQIARKAFEHFQSADLFAQVVVERDGKLGLSIDAFAQHRHAFPRPWDPRKYSYGNTGWGAYNFNLYFLEQGYTTFLDNLGDHELADVYQRAWREIETNLTKMVVVITATTPSQSHRILYYDDDLLFLVRDPGDERIEPREEQPGLFVYSKAHGRWVEIYKISTQDGAFGSSSSDAPEAQEKLAKIPVTWDFTEYRHKPHVVMPLRTSGSMLFPDRIEYDAISRQYRLRFYSKLNIASAETTLYIPRADLLANFGPTS